MATDEEYLDNLLKAAMEDDNQLQDSNIMNMASNGAETIDEEEEWKNSLDEMLASVNAEENGIDGDIAMTDIDFSSFTDIMDESEENYQETEGTDIDGLDMADFGITDLGLDMMEEDTSGDSDMNQEAVNDLMYIAQTMDKESMSLQDEYATHEADEQEEQEERPKKSRKQSQEEKKEQKRLAKEEKRMAKERKKDEKKAEKESKKEARKAGAFSSFIDFLTEEVEDGEASKDEADAEGEDAIRDLEDTGKGSGKKDKKKKKKEKGKKQKTEEAAEEGSEGEAAPDPKKAAKEAKKALKEQKKRERAEQKANEPRVKVLSRKSFMVLVAFCATIVAAVVFLSVFLSDYVDKTKARRAFYNGDYTEAYLLLYGKDLNTSDQVIYHRVSLRLQLDRKLEMYEYYLNEGEVPQALDVLLQGVAQYNEIALGDTYGAGDELRSVYVSMLDILGQQYGLSEEEAVDLLTRDDITYSRIIYEITLGVDFGLPGSSSNEPQAPQDILPEEEDIINVEVAGEGA